MATRAQIEANKKNAKKSTGPKTEAGKKRSSLNSLVHGLRSEEVVLPGEDPAAFEAELAAWFADFQPRSQARAALVERAAVAAWRCRRCVRIERERLFQSGQQAIRKYEALDQKRVDEAVASLLRSPERSLAILEADRPGLARLVGLWSDLADLSVAEGDWGPNRHRWMMAMLGLDPGAPPAEAGLVGIASWRLAVRDDPEAGVDPYGAFDDEDAATHRRVLHQKVVDYLDDLQARHDAAESFRDRMALTGYVDASDEGKLLLRYEATHDRSLRASIAALVQLEKSGADLAGGEPEPAPEPAAPSEPIGQKPAADRDLQTVPSPGPVSAPVHPLDDVDAKAAAQAGRDRGGRSWGGDEGSSSLSSD